MDNLITVINTAILVSTAAVAWFTIRATKRKTLAEGTLAETSAAEAVTEAALKLLNPLTTRITALEAEIKRLTDEIKEMRKLEEYLQAEVYSRDKEIKKLTAEKAANAERIKHLKIEIVSAEGRIAHLEDVCKRAGINGDDLEEEL